MNAPWVSRWPSARCENNAFLQLPLAKLFVEVAVASPVLSSPLGHPLDDLKFSSDDPAFFLES